MIGIVVAAWYGVLRRPLRTLAGIAGMVVAVTALITVDASGVLSRSAAEGYFRRHFGQPATIDVRLSSFPSTGSVAHVQHALFRGLRQNGIKTVSKMERGTAALLFGDRSEHVDIVRVNSGYPSIRVIDLIAGSFPTRSASPIQAHAVISEELLAALQLSAGNAVGQRVDIVNAGLDSNPDVRLLPAESVTIDGVMSATAAAFSSAGLLLVGGDQPPASTAGWLLRVSPADVVLARQTVASVGDELKADGTQLESHRIDQDEQLAPIMDQQKRTSTTVAWVAMLVGGFGLLGIGLASIRERSRELGIRRALGATRLAIFAGVVVETLLSALVAVVVAVPAALIVVRQLSRQLVIPSLPPPSHPSLPIPSALHGLIAATAVGLLAALLPAGRAIKLAVAEAVRN